MSGGACVGDRFLAQARRLRARRIVIAAYFSLFWIGGVWMPEFAPGERERKEERTMGTALRNTSSWRPGPT